MGRPRWRLGASLLMSVASATVEAACLTDERFDRFDQGGAGAKTFQPSAAAHKLSRPSTSLNWPYLPRGNGRW